MYLLVSSNAVNYKKISLPIIILLTKEQTTTKPTYAFSSVCYLISVYCIKKDYTSTVSFLVSEMKQIQFDTTEKTLQSRLTWLK